MSPYATYLSRPQHLDISLKIRTFLYWDISTFGHLKLPSCGNLDLTKSRNRKILMYPDTSTRQLDM